MNPLYIFFIAFILLMIGVMLAYKYEPLRYRVEKTHSDKYIVKRGYLFGMMWETWTYTTPWGVTHDYGFDTPEEAEDHFLYQFKKNPPNEIIKTVVKKGG